MSYVLIRGAEEVSQRLEFLADSLREKGDFPVRLDIKKYVNKRSLSQNALFHLWCAQISDYLVARGRANSTEENVKVLMKHKFLGYRDVVIGDLVIKDQLRRTRDLDTGEMHYFMSQTEAWASGIGCLVTIPHQSEYAELARQQNQ